MRRLRTSALLTGAAILSLTTLLVTTAGATAAGATPAGRPAARARVLDPVDLGLTVSGVPNPIGPNGTISYTITVSNDGPAAAPAAILSVPIPTGATFASFTNASGWTATTPDKGATGMVTATTPSLAPKVPATFSLAVQVSPDLQDGSTVELSAAVSSDGIDLNADNNTATATTTVQEQADVGVTVSGGQQAANAGATLTYTVTLTNAGPAAAADTRLTLSTPSGTAFASFTAPPGWAVSAPSPGGAGTVTATIGSYPPGGPTTFTLTLTVLNETVQGTKLQLPASVSSATPDPRPANNTVSQTATVANAADLVLTMSGQPDPVPAGGQITYTINLVNNGPTPAKDPTLSIGILSGTGFVSFQAPDGWNASTPKVGAADVVTASTATLAPNASTAFTLVLSVSATDRVSLTATVNSATADPAANNNTATLTTAIAAAAQPSTKPTGNHRSGLRLSGTAVARLAGAVFVLTGLTLLMIAISRARRARRAYRYHYR